MMSKLFWASLIENYESRLAVRDIFTADTRKVSMLFELAGLQERLEGHPISNGSFDWILMLMLGQVTLSRDWDIVH